jgi:predicted nucleotidyltransferase
MVEISEKRIHQEIESIVRQIINKYHPMKVILFGSAARGDFSKANDLDFLIIKDDVPHYGIDRMRELDEIIDRDMAADMLVYRQAEFDERLALGDPFIKSILKEGRVLYG